MVILICAVLICAVAIVILFSGPQSLPDFQVYVSDIECIAALRHETYRYYVHLTIRNNGTSMATQVGGYVQFWTHQPVSAGLILLSEGRNEIAPSGEVNCAVHLVSPDIEEVEHLFIQVSCAEGVTKEFTATKP